jgi:hypothetical protein|tara:strand:+ start:1972 stop:2277 length:306 start_codon:yes stop_codon:yes gene_type:complete
MCRYEINNSIQQKMQDIQRGGQMSHEGNDNVVDDLRDQLDDPRIRVRIKVGTNSKHEIQWENSIEVIDNLSNSEEVVTLVQEKSDLITDYLRRRYDSYGGY